MHCVVPDRNTMSKKILQVAFIGAGAINFGGAEGPWDHATRLEKLGGVEVRVLVNVDAFEVRNTFSPGI